MKFSMKICKNQIKYYNKKKIIKWNSPKTIRWHSWGENIEFKKLVLSIIEYIA